MSKTSLVNPLDEDAQVTSVAGLSSALQQLLEQARAAKPNDRSEIDRHWAIFITQLEQAQSTFVARIQGASHE